MNLFAWALAGFVLIHIGISATGLRKRIVGAIGEWPYRGLFSLASGALLVALIAAVLPLPVLFMIGFAVAMLLNYPTIDEQKALLSRHAGNVLAVVGLIFAAGMIELFITPLRLPTWLVINDLGDLKGKLRVLVSIFGRATPVELDFTQVEKA